MIENPDPGDLAKAIADIYLVDELAPAQVEGAEEATGEETESEDSAKQVLPQPALAEFVGAYVSGELDATWRIAQAETYLTLSIEQEPPIELRLLTDDRFEADFHPAGWSGPASLVIEFDRNRSGRVIGFGMSMESIRGIAFDRRDQE